MDLIDSTATMAWNNSSLLTSSQHHRCTYDDEGSQNYLFAVGGGLGIATPIKDEFLNEPLDDVLASSADGATPSLIQGSQICAPPLIIEPPYVGSLRTLSEVAPHPGLSAEAFSSNVWSGPRGVPLAGWQNNMSLQNPQNPYPEFHMRDLAPSSPCPTSQGSSYAPSEAFSDGFDGESLHQFSMPGMDRSDRFQQSLSASDIYRAGTPASTAYTADPMEYDWPQQSSAMQMAMDYDSNAAFWSPSSSTPNSPYPNTNGFESTYPRYLRHGTSDDSESTLMESSSRTSSRHLAVPILPQPHRRNSDPIRPQPDLYPSPSSPSSASSRTSSPNRVRAYSNYEQGPTRKNDQAPYVFQGMPNLPSTALTGPKKKGVRTGRLSDVAKKQAHQTRMDKRMCLGCKISKVKCEGHSDPCVRCASKSTDKRPRVCSRAYFLKLIKAGSTNFMMQHHIYHIRSDGISRRLITMPAMFDLPTLVSQLHTIAGEYDVGVFQGNDWLCSLDLGECFAYLSSSLVQSFPQNLTFAELVNEKLSQCTKNKEWEKCIKTAGQELDGDLGTWIQWDILPSHLTYCLISKVNGSRQVLNPDNSLNVEIIKMAAQLFGAFSRALELSTYERLEALLKKDLMIEPDFLLSLGHLLLLLRWRLCWWKHLGTNLPCEQYLLDQRDLFLSNTHQLCWCLYIYYCFNRRQRLHMEHLHGQDMGGRTSHYPNARRAIYERFPGEESIQGFELWMSDGEDLFRQSGCLNELFNCYGV